MSRPDAAQDPRPAKVETQEDRRKAFTHRHIKAAVARHHQGFNREEDDFV
jgi:hypothetical protein